MQIIDSWLSDLPQQFIGKERIAAVIEAFSRQLQEIQEVFDDLNNHTDIDNAVGQNLDMVGNIVSLTRKDATSIIRKANNNILTDDIYRQTLRYKMLKNSSNCCYEDIMGAVSLLWNTSNITYKEPSDRPATVLLSLPTVILDSIDPAVGRVLTIKPAGVAIIYTVGYWSIIPLYRYEKFLVLKINLLWKFSFYEFAIKNTKRLNGKWLLDGSIPLNGALINVPAKIINHGISTVHSERIDTKHISRLSFEEKEKISLPDAIIRFSVFETRKILRTFDGAWNLDGKCFLGEQRWRVPMFVNMNMGRIRNAEIGNLSNISTKYISRHPDENVVFGPAKSNTEISSTSVVDAKAEITVEIGCKNEISCSLVTKKGIWYLNGSQSLDGNRYLNAIEIKEVI